MPREHSALSTVTLRPRVTACWILASLVAAAAGPSAEPVYRRESTFVETMLATRAAVSARRAAGGPALNGEERQRLETRLRDDFPVEWDWALQDGGLGVSRWFDAGEGVAIERALITKVIRELGEEGAGIARRLDDLASSGAAPDDPRWLGLYVEACEMRRSARLRPWVERGLRLVFTRHHNLGGSHYAYTEAQSDAQNERHFLPGSSLCLLELDGLRARVRTLLDDPDGMIRDPDVSWDGRRVLFSWKRSDRKDDFHLYEMDVASGDVRQITDGLGFADYEGAYLPSGDIVFNSTRCVQTVDCWWTEVSNLYTCDGQGRFLRRLTFDQVHTNYPTVMDDGTVIYTRWEYVDRGQVYPQPLYQMNPDGTGQTEFYGNNSWFPTTILHARGIPGTRRVVAVLSGHHSRQTGKLAIIDPARGRQENEGVREIAPERDTPAVRVDAYGQHGELFQYPYPLSDREFLVAYDPHGWSRKPLRFGIYHMTTDGRRELLVRDPRISCNQPVVLAARRRPPVRPSVVDYTRDTGVYYVQNVYAGPGLAGVPRGTIRSIRVVALEHRAAGVRSNRNGGPAGGALICTPPSIGNGAWDVKIVLGETPVREDGSACFEVPARTPVYFQAVDRDGHVVQTMRSWSTLQPGEYFACVGCHEPKSDVSPPSTRATLASREGPRPLEAVFGPPRGFSFLRDVQPILDRHCVGCHSDRSLQPGEARKVEAAEKGRGDEDGDAEPRAFSLLGETVVDRHAGRRWTDSYLALTRADRRREPYTGKPNDIVRWISAQSVPSMLPPYHAGSARSRLLGMLREGHGKTRLSREELARIACWIDLLVPYCGDYTEANAWSEGEVEKYERFLAKRRRMEELERRNIEALLEARRH